MAASFVPSGDAGEEALEYLRSTEPPLFLSPSMKLSASARAASGYIFSCLLPYCPKPPVDALLVGESFDAEQIWSQIELLSRPILSSLRREIKRLECVEPPVSVADVKETGRDKGKVEDQEDGQDDDEDEGEENEYGEEEDDGDDDDDDDDGDEEEDDDGDERGAENVNGVEDKFLKIKELEEYMDADEAREYGVNRIEGKTKKAETYDRNKNEVIDDGDEEGDEDDAELGDLDSGDDEGSKDERYEDFFGGRKKERIGKRKGGMAPDQSKDALIDEEENDEMNFDMKNVGTLSTHEKQVLKIHSKIQEMEKANLDSKAWTMQGEVTAAKRPKNSALEVDLDFEQNVRPPPVITEDVTAWLEDIIRKRIIEGQFDDVQRAPDSSSRAPKVFKEMDETKSKKGLAEIYEEEYAQKTGLATAPLSTSAEKMKEAAILYKKICLKLDALSHFHFAPKPVIEEISMQTNIPALTMEEIAPVAVSDAAMLAPEEVFQGKGNVKDEAELSQSDRKRRRHNKKRRFKAEQTKRNAKKARQTAVHDAPNELLKLEEKKSRHY